MQSINQLITPNRRQYHLHWRQQQQQLIGNANGSNSSCSHGGWQQLHCDNHNNNGGCCSCSWCRSKSGCNSTTATTTTATTTCNTAAASERREHAAGQRSVGEQQQQQLCVFAERDGNLPAMRCILPRRLHQRVEAVRVLRDQMKTTPTDSTGQELRIIVIYRDTPYPIFRCKWLYNYELYCTVLWVFSQRHDQTWM